MENEHGSYSDKDVQRIIKRALEMQQSTLSVSKTGDYSLDDIEEVAGELGIPAALVRQAATDITLGSGTTASWFFGRPLAVSALRNVQGQLGEDDLAEMLVSIPGFAGGGGTGAASRRSLTWQSSQLEVTRRGFATEVAVDAVEETTSIRVRERLGSVAGGLFGGLVGGLGIGLGVGLGVPLGLQALGSPGLMVLILAGALGISYAMARAIYNAVYRRRKRASESLVQRLSSYLQDKSP